MAAPLTFDAALALLSDYEADHGLSLIADADVIDLPLLPASGSLSSSENATSSSSSSTSSPPPEAPQNDTGSAAYNRFKRARERKKNELATYRAQVQQLEGALLVLKDQKRRGRDSQHLELASVWRATARRQERARRESEELNAHLKRMVDATLRHTQRLQALLATPQEAQVLMYEKCLRKYEGSASVHDTVAFHNLLVKAKLLIYKAPSLLRLYCDMDFQDTVSKRASVPDPQGCEVQVEAMDTRTLPHDLVRVVESTWGFFSNDGGDAGDTIAVETNGDTLARILTMDVFHNNGADSYTARSIYMRRVDAQNGRVLIVWTSNLEPQRGDAVDTDTFTHETFNRAGFVSLSRLHSDPARVAVVKSYYYVDRRPCGDARCRKGGCGEVDVKMLDASIQQCARKEIKRWMDGIETRLMQRNDMMVSMQSSVVPPRGLRA